jgi:hypothetical protein
MCTDGQIDTQMGTEELINAHPFLRNALKNERVIVQ